MLLSVWIDEGLYERLKLLGESNGRSVSEVIADLEHSWPLQPPPKPQRIGPLDLSVTTISDAPATPQHTL